MALHLESFRLSPGSAMCQLIQVTSLVSLCLYFPSVKWGH